MTSTIIIMDGRIPAFKQAATRLETNVVSGTFDYNWRYASALSHPGNADIRANGRKLGRPDKNLKIDPKILDSYVGRYQIDDGPHHRDVQEGRQAHGPSRTEARARCCRRTRPRST